MTVHDKSGRHRPEAGDGPLCDRPLGDGPGGSRLSATMVPDIVLVLDIAMLFIAALIPYFFYGPFHLSFLDSYVFCVLFVTLASVVLMRRAGLYDFASIMRPVAKSDMVIVSVVSAVLFFLTIAFSLKVAQIYSRVWIYSFAGLSVVLVISGRLAAYRVLQSLHRRSVIGRNVVVYGSGEQARAFIEAFERKRPMMARIVGVFSPDALSEGGAIAGHPVIGSEEELLSLARRRRIDDIIIAMPWTTEPRLDAAISRFRELPVNLFLSSRLSDYQLTFNPAFGHPRELPLFEVTQRPISGWSSLIKSVEDYTLGSLILIVLSPLLVGIAIAIKLDSPGPVFFKQRRLGFNNKEFMIYKFRSMYHREVPEDRVRQASKADPRITRVGRFIRRTSIDELPQLFNVMDGTMSLVGPRPHAISHNEDYGRQIRGYFARHKVKPGITGWAQVNNLRGETETLDKMEARVAHDVYYAENWSLLFDLRILVMTAIVVLFQKTAY